MRLIIDTDLPKSRGIDLDRFTVSLVTDNSTLTVNPQYAPSMRTRVYAKRCRQVLVPRSWESLGHDVRQHHRSLTVLQLDITTLDFITNMMVLDVYVLGPTMVHRVFRHLDARLIVFHDLELGSRHVCCCI